MESTRRALGPLLAALATAPAGAADPSPSPPVPGGGGSVEWYEGSWDQLLSAAREQEKVVFVDFWAEWCHWCKELDKRTFSDETAAGVLGQMLTYSVDVETELGKELSQRYSGGRMPLPTLLFLDPSGAPREAIQGFLPPEAFVAEARRILRDEGTIGDLRRRLAADEKDHEARWLLAAKLDAVGDAEGAEGQLERLGELDPDRRSLPLRRLDLEEILEGMGETLDVGPLERFLADEQHGELLFRGWFFVGRVESYLAVEAAREGRESEAEERHAAALAARRRAWKHVPEAFVAIAGREIAGSILERVEHAGADDLALALDAARRAAAAAPEDEETAALLGRVQAAAGRR